MLWMYALFHLANVLLDLCFFHERLLIHHDKKAVISMLWYLFSHDSSAGDLVSPNSRSKQVWETTCLYDERKLMN